MARQRRRIQVAIDGPAASGKSTAARGVAQRLGGFYINTGDMYRAVTWQALERGLDIEHDPAAVAAMLPALEIRYRLDGSGVPVLHVNGAPAPQSEIRHPRVAAQVSHVSAIPEVREWMVQRQRETAELGLIVMEGRDIGTVIFPRATVKFFLTASPEVRARRRLAQPGETPPGATVESVAADIARRDRIDSTRAVAPLRPAADAILIDSSDFTIEQTLDCMVKHIEAATAPARRRKP